MSTALAMGALPGTAWAFDKGPGANEFGLVVVALLVVALAVGAWVSLKERRGSRAARKAPPSDRRAA